MRFTTNLTLTFLTTFLLSTATFAQESELPPPNILWLSWEDVGVELGCYGDEYARTPNVDSFAEEGILYKKAYSNYPVCAAARTTMVTGQYASAYGGQHMRSSSIPPPEVRLYPELLRRAGYFCTNDSKDDFQLSYDNDMVWNRQGNGVRWHDRAPGQPFFSVINYGSTHEGQTRLDNSGRISVLEEALGENRHDPAKAPLPPYFPDTEKVRASIAQYYDNLTYTDSLIGDVLAQLEEEGLAENTIVFFWGDHGWGVPRGKRWPYESGLKVPLIIRVPEKYREWAGMNRDVAPGTRTDELVSFVDFAPTLLSLVGADIPDYMHGKAFLGPQAKTPRNYVYGGRGRMDETYDCIRVVLDQDFLYIRNYKHHLPYAQTVRTMERHPIMQEWRRLHKAGELNETQAFFFQETKPVEELYDLRNDPHQVNNLAGESRYSSTLEKFRAEHLRWMREIGDVGLIPEAELDALKWPNGEWSATAPPIFIPRNRHYLNGQTEITLEAPTSESTMAWRFEGQNRWTLYTRPIAVSPNRILEAKAKRLGFYTSPVVQFKLGVPVAERPPMPPTFTRPWQEVVKESGLLEKLLTVKALDLEGDNALSDYYNYLDDPENSVRYWAILGIRHLSQSKKEKEKAQEVYESMLNDKAPVVQNEAAFGLAKLGEKERGIAVLRRSLDHPQETVRLQAANLLDKMGEDARLALPFPEIPNGTANNYSHRVLLRIYKKLGITPDDLDYPTHEQRAHIRQTYNTMVVENVLY